MLIINGGSPIGRNKSIGMRRKTSVVGKLQGIKTISWDIIYGLVSHGGRVQAQGGYVNSACYFE
jgi:hypothetical protein